MFENKGVKGHNPEIEYQTDIANRICILLKWNDIEIGHSFFIDRKHNTVLLRTSGSVFRGKDIQFRKYVSNLNRYLHWQEILHFKFEGFSYFDFGGLGFLEQYENPKSELQGIIKFKKSFGGEIKYIYRYDRINYKKEILNMFFLPFRLGKKIIKKLLGRI